MVTKIPELMKQRVECYLRDTLGITPAFQPWESSKALPFYLRDRYSYLIARFLETESVLMMDGAAEERTPATIATHMQQVRKQGGRDVIYVREAVTSYNRKRLIEHRVPFIVPGNQMYLPTLGIDLREHLKDIWEARATFSPSTQALVLHILYQKESDSLRPSQLSKTLGYNKMTMGRSFRELEETGLGEHNTSARHRELCFTERGKALWEKVKPHLETPVKKRIFVSPHTILNNGFLAGLSALARYTMLAEPMNPVYAFSDDEWKTRSQIGNVTTLPYEEPGSIEIELWSYSPSLFAENGVVDRLSLFLSLKDHADERVQAALDELMGGMKW